MANRLNPEQRQRDLAALSNDDFDVVVIGGGATGAGAALDAASRGLKTALIEAQDWACGASSRTSGLIRGGIRYLYQLDVALVAEAVRERALLLTTIAPHLVKPQSFLWPSMEGVVDRTQTMANIALYDSLSRTIGRGALPRHRRRTRAGVLERFPDVNLRSLTGAIEFYDARVDDSRLVITLVRTAVEYGAVAVNRTQVVKMARGADGPVTGVVVRDLETGTEFQVRTRGVVIATGVWTEQTQTLAGSNEGLRLIASKGVHLVVPKDRIQASTGIFARAAAETSIYLVPWPNYWVIGTTDTAWHQPLAHPVPTSTDIDDVLRRVNRLLAQPLTRDDIGGTFAGLRPLLQRPRVADSRTARLSREHAVAQVAPGVVSVAGGKLTTYRKMGEDAIDLLLGKKEAAARPSVTKDTPLLGAQGISAMANQADRIGGIYRWSEATMARLLERYGSELPDLLEMVDDDPTMAAPLHSAPEYLRVEVARACVAEGAEHLEDILVRRVRLNTELRDRGAAAVDEVAAIAAPLLDWDPERLAAEKQNYLARVAAEAEAELETSDVAALGARLRASDVVSGGLE